MVTAIPGCTETPLVVWGSGVATAAAAKDVEDGIDPTCRSRGKDAPTPEYAWGLRDDERCDVDQADVAPMGAALLGMPPQCTTPGYSRRHTSIQSVAGSDPPQLCQMPHSCSLCTAERLPLLEIKLYLHTSPQEDSNHMLHSPTRINPWRRSKHYRPRATT